ncbi:MAG: universal stress protein [Candidatus Binatia bacterium]|nr:universal stress protein [Candidatus Binatia bacterium]
MLEPFRRILVTTDFSEAGDRAIPHAFRMAADHGAEVILCHVIEPVIVPNPLYAQYYPGELLSPDVLARAQDDARVALTERVPRDEALAGVQYRVVVGQGAPVEEIIRIAEAEGVDLIVIATHGHTGLKHLLMGSVAERVVRHARCAVLVVR